MMIIIVDYHLSANFLMQGVWWDSAVSWVGGEPTTEASRDNNGEDGTEDGGDDNGDELTDSMGCVPCNARLQILMLRLCDGWFTTVFWSFVLLLTVKRYIKIGSRHKYNSFREW
jgi:hypothetical protein